MSLRNDMSINFNRLMKNKFRLRLSIQQIMFRRRMKMNHLHLVEEYEASGWNIFRIREVSGLSTSRLSFIFRILGSYFHLLRFVCIRCVRQCVLFEYYLPFDFSTLLSRMCTMSQHVQLNAPLCLASSNCGIHRIVLLGCGCIIELFCIELMWNDQ